MIDHLPPDVLPQLPNADESVMSQERDMLYKTGKYTESSKKKISIYLSNYTDTLATNPLYL